MHKLSLFFIHIVFPNDCRLFFLQCMYVYVRTQVTHRQKEINIALWFFVSFVFL